MAAPPKPWERRGVNMSSNGFQNDQNSLGQHVNHRSTTASAPGAPSINRNYHSATSSIQRAPPPLPARPSQMSSLGGSSAINRYGYGGYGGGGMGYGGSYGGGMYGSYGGMYSSYGGGGMYGGGMGGYGAQRFGMGAVGNEPFSRFVQQAEESSRPAFQSIESIVQAFASVSMMLESTFHTVYNSFRAVLGVAEHFSRLKLHLAKIFSAIALFRFLRYLYRKLLVLVGLRTQGFAEDIWKEVESQAADGALATLPAGNQKKAPSWPIFMFFAVVVGGPYIIWKLLSSNEEEESEASSPEWASGQEDHVVARAEYDFDGDGQRELSFHAGDMLNLAPKDQQPRVRGWLLASSGGNKTGIVPANYVKILGKRRGRKYTQAPNGQQQDGGLKASQSTGDLAAGSNPLHTSQSVPANMGQNRRTVDFSDAFTASASNADLDSRFVEGAATDDLESRFVAAADASGPESDFIFGSENANNSNSAFGAASSEDFAGFENTFSPGEGSQSNQRRDAS